MDSPAVTPFVSALHQVLEDPQLHDIICWWKDAAAEQLEAGWSAAAQAAARGLPPYAVVVLNRGAFLKNILQRVSSSKCRRAFLRQ